MTDDEVEAAAARAEAATAGPWVATQQAGDEWWFGAGDEVVVRGPAGGMVCVTSDDGAAEMAFIAHARTDVPALAAEVLRLRALIAAMVEAGE